MSVRRRSLKSVSLALIAFGMVLPVQPSLAERADMKFIYGATGVPEAMKRSTPRRSGFRILRRRDERRLFRSRENHNNGVVRRSTNESPVRRDIDPVEKVAPPTFKTFRAEPLITVDFGPLLALRPEQPQLVSSGLFLSLLPRLETFTLMAEKDVAAALAKFYAAHPSPLWLDGLEPNAQGRAALALLAAAEDDGLDPADYALGTAVPAGPQIAEPSLAIPVAASDRRKVLAPALATSAETTGAIDPRAAADGVRDLAIRFEMALSARLLRYGRDLAIGRLDPDALSGFHDLPRQSFDGVALMNAVAEGQTPAAAVRALAPKDPAYDRLLAELADLRGETTHLPRIEGKVLWKPGTSDERFPDFLTIVEATAPADILNDYQASLATYRGDTYAPELVPLIKALQKSQGLSQDGIIGPRTIAGLVPDSPAEKIEKIELSLERLRWLPRELGPRRVFINQPEFVARYYENGVEDMKMDIVVGTKTNQTSFFYDEIETVVFRPYWGVPRSIIINEYLAKLRADPSYFDRNGYEVVSGGREVSSRSVDWWSSPSSLNVGVRQKPGPENALGELKILFPNRHNIYMHDTPSKYLFSRTDRAYSHGCVRLANPRLMAAKVLGVDETEIDAHLRRARDGEHEKVPSTMPVYLGYFTAWPAADGRINIFDDVYGRDEHLLDSLEKVSASRAV